MSGGVAFADYPDYAIGFFAVDGGRQDTTVFYAATIGLPDASYAGFTPSVTIAASSTDSNVSRFTRDTFSAGITLSSQF